MCWGGGDRVQSYLVNPNTSVPLKDHSNVDADYLDIEFLISAENTLSFEIKIAPINSNVTFRIIYKIGFYWLYG